MTSNLDLLKSVKLIPQDYGNAPSWQLIRPSDRPIQKTLNNPPAFPSGSGGGGGGSSSGGGGSFVGTQVSPELQKQITTQQNKTAPDNSKLLEQQKQVAVQNLTYRQFITDKNPVSGTLQFFGEKIKTASGEQPTFTQIPETRRVTITPRPLPDAPAPIRNPTFSEFATNIGTAGLFFVPYLGEGLLVASAAGSLTKGGQKEISTQSQQTGIPAPALTTLNLFGGALGTASLISRASKLAGYPKYETQFLGKAQADNQISSVAMIKQKNLLLPDKKYIAVSQDKLLFQESENGLFNFVGTSKSSSREIERNLIFPTGKSEILLNKPTTASSVFYGEGTQSSLNLIGKTQQGLTPSSIFEGFLYKSASRSQISGKPLSSSIGSGVGIRLNDELLLSGSKFRQVKGNKLLRYGESKNIGVVKLQPESQDTIGTLFFKSQKLSKGQIQKEISKQQVQQSLIASIPKTQNKNVGAFGLITSARNKPTTSQSLFYGTGQYEKTETSPIFNSKVAMTSANLQKNPLVNIAGLAQPTKERETFGLILPSGIAFVNRQPQGIGLIFNQKIIQNQRQPQQQKHKMPFGSSFVNPLFHPKQTKTPPLFIKTNDEDNFKREYGFLPVAKRRGRWIPLSKPVTRSQAFGIASNYVDKSLSRSFQVVRTNQKVKSSGFGIAGFASNRFRPSRKNSNIFVERSKFALGRTGEQASIQRARRSYSKTRTSFTSRRLSMRHLF